MRFYSTLFIGSTIRIRNTLYIMRMTFITRFKTVSLWPYSEWWRTPSKIHCSHKSLINTNAGLCPLHTRKRQISNMPNNPHENLQTHSKGKPINQTKGICLAHSLIWKNKVVRYQIYAMDHYTFSVFCKWPKLIGIFKLQRQRKEKMYIISLGKIIIFYHNNTSSL